MKRTLGVSRLLVHTPASMKADLIQTTPPVTEIAPAADRARTQYRYDVISTRTGVILALFMWGHMMFVSSILLGGTAFDWLAAILEDTWIAQPTVIVITVLFFVHFVLASRKIPAKLQERRLIKNLGDSIQSSEWRISPEQRKVLEKIRPHSESSLWIWQVRTGMIILALGAIHLFVIGVDVLQRTFGEEGITAAESTARVSAGMWLLYAVLLVCVEVHAGIGLYRVAIKWALGLRLPLVGKITRGKAHVMEQITLWFFLAIGLVTLLTLAGVLEPPLASLLAGGR
jgi:fumarate reductase subunit C